jgi:3-methyladenine DNA glycosylase AlkD
MMHQWVVETQTALAPLANEENASFMKSYMRGQFEFYGIQSGPRREAMKHLFTHAQLPKVDELSLVIDELWSLPQREFQMVAVDLLIKMKKKLPVTMLADLQRWITTKSWWDTVDMLATHIAGGFYLRYPNETMKYIALWRSKDNIWLRRTTLLYQLKYKENTDVPLLFSLIKDNKRDSDFFIQKAIGWVLREYSKTDAEAVIALIETEKLQGLAKREGLKWLKSQGHIPSSF